jgi:hypothetical protein
MRNIEIDDEVFSFLQSRAVPYEETTPNMTLRRLLGLVNKEHYENSGKTEIRQATTKRRKQPKTNLVALINAGLIREGQKLYLYDYQNKIIPGYEAIISGNSLLKNGEPYSMSKLAEMYLKDNDYKSDSVQGPARWFTADGTSILKLWKNHINKSR